MPFERRYTYGAASRDKCNEIHYLKKEHRAMRSLRLGKDLIPLMSLSYFVNLTNDTLTLMIDQECPYNINYQS